MSEGRPVIHYFVSYAHEDQKLKEDLLKRLKKYLRISKEYKFEHWEDKEILPGARWRNEIQAAVNHCQFGLLLLSPDFLGSEFIKNHELPAFVDSPKKWPIPVALTPIPSSNNVDWGELKKLQIFRAEGGKETFEERRSSIDRDNFASQLSQQIHKIVQRQVNSDVHEVAGRNDGQGRDTALPSSGLPTDIVRKDFLVFLTLADLSATEKLSSVVKQAYRELEFKTDLGNPAFPQVADVVASEENLRQAINALCQAKVVVFDATGFEPAIMLLAGIRAVVRRGVTILSIGGDYALGGHLSVPFNVMDANIVAHSKEQDKPIELLSNRIQRGLDEIKSPYYLDLPVFDALRRIPVERRGIIAKEEGVLVLCPFDETYTKENWKKLKGAFENELKLLRKLEKKERKPDLGVARSFELNSPRLFTQAFYEAIRRAQACVVDLTGWSSNVLFELGVRLAASSAQTACMIAKDWQSQVLSKWDQELINQCDKIVKLFVPEDLKYDLKLDWKDDDANAYGKAYGSQAVSLESGPASGTIHALIESVLDVDSEPASRPVYEELLDSAELFARPPGKSKPVGLYPGNLELPRREEEADFERLLAAWFYLSNRFSDDELLNAKLEATQRIILLLAERHGADAESKKILRPKDLSKIGTLVPLFKLNDLKAIKNCKTYAAALRNLEEFDSALAILDKAIRGLVDLRKKGNLDSRLVTDVRAELADTYGMKGGIYRRLQQKEQALKEYRKGLKEESGQQSTYNLSNVITLEITVEHTSPADAEMRKKLDKAIKPLKTQVDGARSDEWWALTDLAQFYLLNNEPKEARSCYERALKTGPTIQEYNRHIDILRELMEATKDNAPEISKNIAATIVYLEQHAR